MKTMIFACLIVSTGAAYGADSCESALVRASTSVSSSVSDDWRLATLVDNNTYDQVRHDAGASAVIYGVPVGASYSDFKQNVARQYQTHNESRTHSELVNIAWTGLNADSEKAYQDCLNEQLFNSSGLHAAVQGATVSDISILVKWDVPGNAHAAVVAWSPKSIGDTVLPTTIPHGLSTVRVPRPNQQLALSGNSVGYTTGDIVLEPLPPPPKPWVDYSKILCEVQSELNHPAPPPEDVSYAGLGTCRAKTELLAPLYRFVIHCLNTQGSTVGLSKVNADGAWPSGCVVAPGQ